MTRDEPFGHRGHPTWYETQRARYVGERIGTTIEQLVHEGFGEREAIAFIAGIAFERATKDGETWHSISGALRTVDHVLHGGLAKQWSLDAILVALNDIGAIMFTSGSTPME